jgi:alkylation response protein AidB-like acyl-CoA dehydrogenase
MELSDYRAGLDAWLDKHADELTPDAQSETPLADEVAHLSRVKKALWESEWGRWGWPEIVDGLGGSVILRAYLGEALMARYLVAPNAYSMAEFLAPTVINFATDELVKRFVPPLLKGEVLWCQGFSEPDTGSNLGSLQCRATRSDHKWIVNGQKVWTSYAQFSEHCVLLARTGGPESRHEGISAFFIDMDTPGITIRPLRTMDGVEEFCEVFFEDVEIPDERMIGTEGQGWELAMSLLPLERSTSLWHRGAYVRRELQRFVETVPAELVAPAALGQVALQLFTLRSRSRATQYRAALGDQLGPETSVDKLLLVEAEQAAFDLVLDGMSDGIVLGDDQESERWRSEFIYSRACSIYGGSMEIQRNILAQRVLGLGKDR